ncbi:CehA/McbA family metallohydrolase [Sphingomonas sp. 28-62-11]|uniref:CehA/McbA family metallohydrolase n=1 Tax=Sphingomonas sp. 28-62-11 TaxID=1970432 RepID=UPI000BDA2F2B|nr:MAG: hypothetical protein B7Y49_10430 [Sphingomonas sp. 28-62-11]
MSVIRLLILLLAVFYSASAASQIPERVPDKLLTGTITRADFQTYRRFAFTVPRATERLVVAFDYDQREAKTVIDLGIDDMHGFRGASGGNKADFTISESDATPSYLPGRINAGRWHLVLAVPNIRAGITARWQAKLWFLKAGEVLPSSVIDRGGGWYRGDLHLHTAHSDGACASQSGKRVPCPLFKTLEAAAARGLDFLAVTEHNTTSAHAALREAAPLFDRLLLIPGREITSFYGHFNIFGVTEPIDYRITPGGPVTFNSIADRVHALGGLVSINHPGLPSGEACMGCGWTMPDADLDRVDAVEVVNGGAARLPGGPDGPLSGARLWRQILAGAKPVTAVGGSDNHDALQAPNELGSIGRPTTVVRAEGLNQAAILAGIRSGRVFVDMEGRPGSMLDLRVAGGGSEAVMGGRLIAAPNVRITARMTVKASPGSRIELLGDDTLIASANVDADQDVELLVDRRERPLVVRAIVRAPGGAIHLLSNAVIVAAD